VCQDAAVAREYAAAAEFRSELRRFLRRSEEAAREQGLTPQQHLLLLMIAGTDDGVSTVSTLVDRLQLTQSAVTELVQRAEEASLLSRRPSSADGRVVELRLTPEGERRLGAVHRKLGPERQHLREIVDRLPD
jgi:DNA-binding MarR family transcriptional regulator